LPASPNPVIILTVKRIRRLWLTVIILLAACRGPVSPAGDPTPVPPTSTPTPVPETPEAVAAAFLTAWEQGDTGTMYALLSPAVRAAVPPDRFAARYQSAVQTATVLTATATLRAVLQEGARAQAAARLSWETALVGTLVADTVIPLVLQDGHWWVEGSGDIIWPGLGEANYLYMDYQIPARANIYDRNGRALAAEGKIVTVGVVPSRIQDEGAVLAVLSRLTGLSPEAIRARYEGRPADWWSPVADIPAPVSIENADLLLNTPGIEAREKPGRVYWGDGIAPHVVGWVGLIPAEQAEAYRRLGYRGDEWVGVAGLEAWGEMYLAGRHGGTLYLMSPTGQTLEVLARRDAVPSRALYTTLDREFQQKVEEILGDRRGAIVVLDVHTGAVLAMASGPNFNQNVFVGPGSALERAAVLSHPDRPLLNRATQGLYPTGSVFKIVTMAAGLEKGGLTPESTFWCPGYWEGMGAAYQKQCWKAHGSINLKDALTASCNTTFFTVGQQLDGIDPNLLPTFGRAFGLGVPTGLVGIPEAAGLIPDPAWKQAASGTPWWPGDSVNLAIGQGDLLVTPLQVARMMAAVANGGTLYRPYVVARIAAAGTEPEVVFQPEAVGTLPVSPEHLAVIREALAGVTTAPIGTATHRFLGMSIPVAGKTGTAENPGREPHSWFAGFAPADNPQIAFAVVVENAGEGSTVAAPMARQVVEAYFGLPLTPLPPEALPTPTPQP
jgi:penicillin-binding protein 2